MNINLFLKSSIILISILVLTACTRTEALEVSGDKTVEVECFPVYGNWCGEGYPAYETTGYKPEPVDIWDASCKAHDLCYDELGKEAEGFCDRKFATEIETLYQKGYPVPHAMSAAYTIFNGEFKYRPMWLHEEDIRNPLSYSCRGGEGKAALFCDVGKGRDDCQVNISDYVISGECSCEYSDSIWDEPTVLKSKNVYSANN